MVYVLLQLYMLFIELQKVKKMTSQKQIKKCNILKFTNEMLLLQYSSLQML